MIQSDLVRRIAELNPHLYEKDRRALVTAIVSCITTALVAGDRVEIRNFGSFAVRAQRARDRRNPKTGALVSVPAKVAVVFRTGRGLQKSLNQQAKRTRPPI
ncbi:integration host factor subunit beta [Methylobacterium sp. WL116]|nr:integration host factor subunit beta [Methylobacterium sp. WL116]